MAAFSNWLGQLFDDGHLHADEAQLSQWQKIHHPFLSEDDLGTDLGKGRNQPDSKPKSPAELLKH